MDKEISKPADQNLPEEDMNIKIQNASPHKEGGDNKGSCAALANYLTHEDEQRIEAGLEPLPFLKPDGTEVTMGEVIDKIDRNHKHLGKNDDKFYHIIVSPSAEEIAAMGATEAEQYKAAIQYIHALSDAYAESFKRETIHDASDITIFWKTHTTRGDNGDSQLHMHGMVARNSNGANGKTVKLSPMTTHRDTQNGPVTGGFDRKEFFIRCEKLFDKLFDYDRKVSETFDYNNAMVHGTPEEMADQERRLKAEKLTENKEAIAKGIEARRKTVQNKNAVSELANILKNGESPLGQQETAPIAEAIDIACYRNDIQRIIKTSSNKKSMELNFLAAGYTCKPEMSNDGLEDITFVKGSKLFTAKDLFDPQKHRAILLSLCKITGQAPAFIVRELRAAKSAEKQSKEDTQHKLTIKKKR